jgi:hypothetical protein
LSPLGPRTDDILRAGLLTLRELPGTPLLTDLPKLLSIPAFRQRAVDQIHGDVPRGFWSFYDALSDPARAHRDRLHADAAAPGPDDLRSPATPGGSTSRT